MIRVVRLGSGRAKGEGVRIGTVRRPPRGVPKAQWASRNFYDVWLPQLSPSPALVSRWLSAEDEAQRARCAKKFRAELKAPEVSRLLELLVALSKTTDFAVGCYCEDEAKCHRSVLRAVLTGLGARIG